jgi:HSP20 family protein
MNLVRFDPLRELEGLTGRLNRFFDGPLANKLPGDGAIFGDWSPAIDIEETDGEYLLKTDLPAMKREEVKVGITDGVLTVEGERQHEKEEKGKKFHKIERSFGRFVRRVAVPTDVDQQKVSAEFKDGVLSVHLPKSESAKPRYVDVKIV